MATWSRRTLFGEEQECGMTFDEIAVPIMLGGAVGLGTGVVILAMIVVHFGLMGWFWP